ncbi:MAG: hypothetical protein ACRDTD_09630 [Pseudonocardiaceae bacterium]
MADEGCGQAMGLRGSVMSHSPTVMSELAVARTLPAGLNAKEDLKIFVYDRTTPARSSP